jgi:GAF domain-containing protein
LVAVAHADAERVALACELAERYPVSLHEPTGAAEVFRSNEPQCTNAVSDEMLRAATRDVGHLAGLRALGMHAVLMVSMTSGGRNVGKLSLVSAESRRNFTAPDVALACELGRRAGVAVENARL